LFRLAAVLSALAIIGVAVLGARLASGPIRLTWLAPHVERAIQPADQRLRIEVGDALLRFGEDRVVELVGEDVLARGPGGELLIELPEIEVGISLEALIWRGMLAPVSLAAQAPRLVLGRNEDGAFGLRGLPASGRPAAPRGEIALAALLDPLLSADPDEPLAYLHELSIAGGQLVLEDRVTDHTLLARNAELTARRLVDGLAARLAFDLDQAGEPATVLAEGGLEAATGRISFAIGFAGLSAAELVEIEPALPLQGVDLALTGRVTGNATRQGDLAPLQFELRVGGGTIERPDLLAGPLRIGPASMTGEIAADLAAVTIRQARLVDREMTVSLQAEAAWRAPGLSLRADVKARNVAAGDLERYWPLEAGREARAWVTENVTAGLVSEAEATIRIEPGDLEQRPVPEHIVEGRFAFDDLTLRYFETMPPLTEVAGSATFTGRRMHFEVAGGRVGEVVVDQGSVVITGIGIKGRDSTQLEIAAQITAPLPAALALIDHPPLGFASDLGIAPDDTSGQASTSLDIGMPLHRDLDESDVRVAASAELRDVGARGLRDRFELSAGQFALTVDNQHAELVGEAAINQTPLAIQWRENFAADAAFERRFQLSGTVDAAASERFGLALPLPVAGAVGVAATVVEARGVREAEIDLDLAPLAIEVPRLGWQKAAGAAGRLTAALSIAPDGPLLVETFELASDELEASGSLAFATTSMQLQELVLGRFRLGRSRGALDLQQRGEGGYRISVRADALDLDPLLEARTEAAEEAEGPPAPLEVILIADRVWLRGHPLSAIDVYAARGAAGWHDATVHALLPAGGRLEARLTAEDGGARLRLTSDDAGDLLQTFDQTARIEGGRLTLQGLIRRQVPVLEARGRLKIDQFTLLDAPLLARLLTVASLTGIGNLLGGEGIHFDQLELPFTLQDEVIAIEEGRMSGSQLGLTVKGQVDLAREQLALEGTVVPLYALNRVLGKIPLVGPFLSGSEGEGAFAVTYSVEGATAEPRIWVNPLSVLAPGFIRDLFGGILDGTLEAPEPAVPQN
jgi:hypothetical protein